MEDLKNKYEEWLNNPFFDEEIKQELSNININDNEFFKKEV